MLIFIFLLSVLNFYLFKKLEKKLFKFFIIFLSNLEFFILHYYLNSVFISTILTLLGTISILLLIFELKISLKTVYFLLILNFFFTIFTFYITQFPLEKDYRWFFGRTDNFADSVKLAVSFEYFFTEAELSSIKNLPDQFKKYNPNYVPGSENPYEKHKYNNPYFLEAELQNIGSCKILIELENICYELSSDEIFNYYSLPPLHLFIKTIWAFLIKILNNINIFLIIIFSLSTYGIYLFSKRFYLENYKIFLLIQLTSYPFIFAILRGNFTSIITYIIFSVISLRYIKKENSTFFDIFLLSILINIRPTYIFLSPIFLITKNLKASFKNISKLIVSILLNFFIFLNLVKIFHQQYSINIFLKLLNYFSDLNIYYTFYSYEFTSVKINGFNVGIYPFIINLKDHIIYILEILGLSIYGKSINPINLYIITSILLLILYLVVVIIKTYKYISKFDEVLFYTLITLLFGPFNGDYHLFILASLFLISIINYEKLKYSSYVKLFFLIFIIKPHSAVFPLYGISLHSLLSGFILLILLSLVLRNIFISFNKKDVLQN